MTALLHFTHTPAMTLHERAARAIRAEWARRQAAYAAWRQQWREAVMNSKGGGRG